MWFLRQDPGWSDLIFANARVQIYPGKGPNKNFGANKFYLGPNCWNLAPKGLTWQPWHEQTFLQSIHMPFSLALVETKH